MRKKLLALLMCATMVLGTAATAFADSYEDADKVLTSWKGFANEYSGSESKLTVSVGSSKYAFTTKAHTNGLKELAVNDYVKVNSDTKELLYVGNAVDLTAYGTITSYDTTPSDGTFDVTSAGVVVPKNTIGTDNVNISIVLAAYAAVTKDSTAAKDVKKYINTKSSDYSAYKLSDLGITTDGIIVNVEDELGEHVVWLTANKDAAITAAVTWTVGAVDLTSGTVKGKKTYVAGDGYSFTELDSDDANAFFSAIKASDANGYSYAYKLKAVTSSDNDYDDLRASVAVSLNSGVLSTDARAARVLLYQYGVNNSTPFLNVVNKPSTEVSIAIANDLLSQTALKAATLDAYCLSSTVDYDKDLATSYNVLSPLDSSLDASAAYKTFSLPLGFTYDNGLVVIFDKSADASQNDGVATEDTTTAASQTAASSPKTGDVAPIAALAVVMMGACGAMVVASKKRA